MDRSHTTTRPRDLKMRTVGIHLRPLVVRHDVQMFRTHEVITRGRELWNRKVQLKREVSSLAKRETGVRNLVDVG